MALVCLFTYLEKGSARLGGEGEPTGGLAPACYLEQEAGGGAAVSFSWPEPEAEG